MLSVLVILIGPQVDGALVAVVDDDGQARGHGAVHIRDGTSNTILIAEGPTSASCADADGDGTGGVTGLSIGLRDLRSGTRLAAEVTPVDGDIEGQGRVKVAFPWHRADGGTLEVDALLRVTGLDGDARREHSGYIATTH